MPKLLLRPHVKPYQIQSEFRGEKWPRDTHEGRVASSEWARFVSEGRGLIDPEDMPESLALFNPKKLKPMFLGGFWNVEEVVKELIEELDPGRHQFVPLNLTGWLGTPYEEGNWFLLNVYFHQSSIIDELTNSDPIPGYEDTHEKMLIDYLAPKVTANPEALSPDAHLWREERYAHSLFMSDELYDRLVALKVKLPVQPFDNYSDD